MRGISESITEYFLGGIASFEGLIVFPFGKSSVIRLIHPGIINNKIQSNPGPHKNTINYLSVDFLNFIDIVTYPKRFNQINNQYN